MPRARDVLRGVRILVTYVQQDEIGIVQMSRQPSGGDDERLARRLREDGEGKAEGEERETQTHEISFGRRVRAAGPAVSQHAANGAAGAVSGASRPLARRSAPRCWLLVTGCLRRAALVAVLVSLTTMS